MNDKQYHDYEIKRALAHLKQIEDAPRADREEGYKELLEAEPSWVAEQVEWMLNGSYGYGEMQLALNTLTMRNPAPSLFHLVSSLNWQTGTYYSRKAWKDTPKDKQELINTEINKVISDYKINQEVN